MTRLIWLAGELAMGATRFTWMRRSLRGPMSLAAQTDWLHETAKGLLGPLHIKVNVSGPIPTAGLLVCNHLSYIDIVALASICPAVFVSKSDVKDYPVFGWFARKGGAIFVDRRRRSQAGRANAEILEALESGALVVLFPEGTSSGGESVQPFKSALLEPAARARRPLFGGLLRYEIDDGDVAEEVCYWKDHTLAAHMINMLGKREIRCDVHFTRIRSASADRKELAQQLHFEVSALRNAGREKIVSMSGKPAE